MGRVKIGKIGEEVYLLDDNGEATGYLVVGSQKAVLIDTMNGYEDVSAIVRSLTDKPFLVVNTHGHCDHIGGNLYVREAYIHPDDLPMARRHMQMIMDSEYYQNNPVKPLPAKWKFIRPGDVIDLGDNYLEVLGVPGHTSGCICLLDRKHRILFSGDGVIPHIWMQLEDSLELSVLLSSLESLKAYDGAYDMILHGHARSPEDAGLLEQLRQGVCELIAGKNENDEDYSYFGGVARTHFYDRNDRNKQIVYKSGSLQ